MTIKNKNATQKASISQSVTNLLKSKPIKVFLALTLLAGMIVILDASRDKHPRSNRAFDILSAAKWAGAIQVNATIYGPQSSGPSTWQDYQMVFFPTSTTSTTTLAMDLFLTYTKMQQRFEWTVVDKRGFYSIFNATTNELIVTNCLESTDMAPLDTFATSLFDAQVIPPNELSESTSTLVNCASGTVLSTMFFSQSYVYCTQENSYRNTYITSVAGPLLNATLGYLNSENAIKLKEKHVMPVPIMTNVFGMSTQCEILDLTREKPLLSSLASTASPTRHLTLRNRADPHLWYLNPNFVHSSLIRAQHGRKLYQPITFFIEIPKKDIDTFSTLISDFGYNGYDGKYSLDIVTYNPRGDMSTGSLQIYDQTTIEFSGNFLALPSFMSSEGIYRRRLKGSSKNKIFIAVPRKCIFFTGSGYKPKAWSNKDGYTPDNSDFSRIKWTDSVLTSPAHHAFGNLHQNKPLYCSLMIFTEVNTYNYMWYQRELHLNMQIALVAAGKKMSPQGEIMGRLRYQDLRLEVDNVIVFTAYDSTLALASGIDKKIVKLGRNTQWVSLYSPVMGIDKSTTSTEIRSQLCTKKNMKKLSKKSRRHLKDNDASYTALMDDKLPGGISVSDMMDACSPYENDIDNMVWLQSLNRKGLHKNVRFNGAKKIMAKRVNAALCGSSDINPLSTKSEIKKIAKKLKLGGKEVGDGVTPLSSCMALVDIKDIYSNADNINDENSDNRRLKSHSDEKVFTFGGAESKYYQANAPYMSFENSALDGDDQVGNWMNRLHLNTDLTIEL